MGVHKPIQGKKVKMTTLTIRIDEDLKNDVLTLAHEQGEDASTWIRRFFEGIRQSKGHVRKEHTTEKDDSEFSPEFIKSVRKAMTAGTFVPFKLEDYV